ISPPTDAHIYVPTLRRPVHPVRDRRAMKELRSVITEFRPDVVHTHTAKAGALGRLAAKSAGVGAIVHTYHGHIFEGYFPAPLSRMYLAIERRLAAQSTSLVAVSERVARDLVGFGIGRTEQWVVAP